MGIVIGQTYHVMVDGEPLVLTVRAAVDGGKYECEVLTPTLTRAGVIGTPVIIVIPVEQLTALVGAVAAA